MSITRQKYDLATIHTITQLDIWDSRLLSCVDFTRKFNPDRLEEPMYIVNISKYAELCGNIEEGTSLQYSKAFAQAVSSAQKLKDEQLEVQVTSGLYYTTSIVHSFLEEREYGLLAINFDRIFLPLVTGNLPAGKFYMPIVEMHTLSSPYTIRMYHLLEQNLWKLQTEPYFVLSIAKIRQTLQLEDKYPRTNTLVDKFVKPTLRALANISKYNLEYKVVKESIKFSNKTLRKL